MDQVGKRMAEHIVEAVQKTVRQARKKARAPAASAFLPAIEDKVDVMGSLGFLPAIDDKVDVIEDTE